MSTPDISALDDRTIMRILMYLTEELREELSEEQAAAVRSDDEARQAIAALLAIADVRTVEPQDVLASAVDAAPVARATLALLLEDPMLRPRVQALLADPPEHTQLSPEIDAAMSAAVILGTLITWLQMKIDLQVVRKAGKTDFSFGLHKQAADPSVVKSTAQAITHLLA